MKKVVLITGASSGMGKATAKKLLNEGYTVYSDSPKSRPEWIADTMSNIIKSNKPKTRYASGQMANTVLIAKRILSDKAFDNFIWKQLKLK